MTVWTNGKWSTRGTWPLDDRGLLFGDQVFETLRVDDGVALFSELHRDRLLAGLLALGLDAGLSLFDEVIAHIPKAPPQASLRITITAGPGRMLMKREGEPRAYALLRPRGPVPPSLRVTVTQAQRGSLIPPQVKHASYLGEILARRAVQPAFDDVIVRNAEGRPCELAAANLFAVHQGKLSTPPVSDGALPGITRCLVLAGEGEERIFSDRILRDADELFATSTLLGICPITQIRDRMLAVGPVTRRVQKRYAYLVAKELG